MSIITTKKFRHDCKDCIFLFHSSITTAVASLGFDVYMCAGSLHGMVDESVVVFRWGCRKSRRSVYDININNLRISGLIPTMQYDIDSFRDLLQTEERRCLVEKIEALNRKLKDPLITKSTTIEPSATS